MPGRSEPDHLFKNNCVQRKHTGKRTSNTRAPISDLKETRSLTCLASTHPRLICKTARDPSFRRLTCNGASGNARGVRRWRTRSAHNWRIRGKKQMKLEPYHPWGHQGGDRTKVVAAVILGSSRSMRLKLAIRSEASSGCRSGHLSSRRQTWAGC